MQKTLGGDRLGSGKKMKVNLHGYERSTHDMGYLWRSTMSAGTLVPFISEVALPGDTFDIHLECDVKTHPTVGPLFGTYKVQLDTFVAPIRLYNAMLHNNALNIGRNMSQVKLPQLTMTATKITDVTKVEDLDNCQINPSSILAYLGIRGIGLTSNTTDTRDFNAVPILAYWEIYKNYYANKQEEIGAVIHSSAAALVNTVTAIKLNGTTLPASPTQGAIALTNGSDIEIDYTGASPLPEQILINITPGGQSTVDQLFAGLVDDGAGHITGIYDYSRWGDVTAITWKYTSATDAGNGQPIVQTFPLNDIDDMRRYILAHNDTVAKINAADLFPYKYIYGSANSIPFILGTQEGLAIKTYQSDLFNNWLSTEWIDGAGGITEVTSIDTSGGSFSLDTLNISKKVYDMLNRIAVSGGSYDDWLDAVYAHDRYQRCESPMYMGGLIKELVFQEVVSNSAAAGDGQPLGTLAGRGVLSQKHKGGNVVIKVDEPSYIIGLISITPRIDYSQGNKWDTHLATLDDLHKPALDEIGFQELITEQMAWWDTHNTGAEWVQKSAGKQPAWINYMTNVNRVLGNFAVETNEMFMTLNRRFEYNSAGSGHLADIKDLTTYIDPVKFNFIFAETSIDAQNFWAQIAVNMTVRRKMSAKVMPNL